MMYLHRILGVTAWAVRPTASAALLSAGLLLSGCGQKGPLFLPTAASLPTGAAEPSSTANANDGKPTTGR